MNPADTMLCPASSAMPAKISKKNSGLTGRAVLAIFFAAIVAMSMATVPAAAQTFTNLYNFGLLPDGRTPVGPLVMDTSGNLYGATSNGGAGQMGTVFQLSPPATSGGAWTETILHSFAGGADGEFPLGGLAIDKGGNLYGTTSQSAASTACGGGCGTVFKLKPPAVSGGTWSYRIMHTFKGGTRDGYYPAAKLTVDSKGVVYGTTVYGGSYNPVQGSNSGTVFKVQSLGSNFSETVLYSFGGSGDGYSPYYGDRRCCGQYLWQHTLQSGQWIWWYRVRTYTSSFRDNLGGERTLPIRITKWRLPF